LYVPYSSFVLQHCLTYSVHVYNLPCLAQSQHSIPLHSIHQSDIPFPLSTCVHSTHTHTLSLSPAVAQVTPVHLPPPLYSIACPSCWALWWFYFIYSSFPNSWADLQSAIQGRREGGRSNTTREKIDSYIQTPTKSVTALSCCAYAANAHAGSQ